MARTSDRARRRPAPAHRRTASSAQRRPGYDDARTRRLVARAKRGDPDAQRLLVELHLELVGAVARRYRGLGLPEEDLAQEGAIGLLEAIERFEPSNGATFATYAYWRIRQAVTHALTDHARLLRLPKDIIERRRAIAKATSAILNDGARPTADELARLTGLSLEAVIEALDAPASVASLDAPLVEGTPLEAAIPDPAVVDPEAAVIRKSETRLVGAALSHLPARERAVIEAHYGFGREPETLADVSHELGVSDTRVRALEQRALRELATELESEITVSTRRADPRS
jgi:RNA polymerase primary sigma factor